MTDRRLLFSLLLLPACEAAVSSSDDPRVPDGGMPEDFQDNCRKYHERYLTCYEGYGYATTGSDDPSDYIEMMCESSERYVLEYYGAACLGAMEEVFACMSSLDCEAVFEDDSDGAGLVPEPCRAVFADAGERCPEVFPP